jgi:thymidylate synthase
MNNIHSSGRPYTKEEFLEQIKIDKEFNEKYGNRKIDQISKIIDGLKNNPYSRYHILDAWEPEDFKEMALPPCHLLYQFIVRPLTPQERLDWMRKNTSLKDNIKVLGTRQPDQDFFDPYSVPKFYLDLNMYQRSCDTFLGVPFNIASMSLLLMIFAKVSNMIPGVATWIGGDTHLYVDHIPMVKEQLTREPYHLPTLIITKELKTLEDILALTIDDFKLLAYVSHPSLKAELFTGIKK